METTDYLKSLRRIVDILMTSDAYTPAEKLDILYAVAQKAKETGMFLSPRVN